MAKPPKPARPRVAPSAAKTAATSPAASVKLTGRTLDKQLPPWAEGAGRVGSVSRGEGERYIPDPFLPLGFLTPLLTVDVEAASRDGAEQVQQTHETPGHDDVLVLELADGSIFVTSAQRLCETLRVTHPELLADDGQTILLDKLRADGTVSRGLFGDLTGSLVRRVFGFAVGGGVGDAVTDAALELLGRKLGDAAELGVTWLGTKALMAAIENKVARNLGLWPWDGLNDPRDPAASAADDDALQDRWKDFDTSRPILVFVHGTASSTMGSFGELRKNDETLWARLVQAYPGGIFGLEHRTLSDSPIENAIQLLESLPRGARVSFVSHSRGGLVADLACLRGFDSLIETYRAQDDAVGTGDSRGFSDVKDDLDQAHAQHRNDLKRLAGLLTQQQITVERYVRAACPANGTKLASGNFDLFISGILTLIGQVPFFFGNPLYSAFKRIVIEIARNRTNPRMVPGIEAMLPDAPLARLLRDAPVQPGVQMGVIAGDIEGGPMLKRLGVLLTDFLLFERSDNDLVVDTAAMLAGVARKSQARVIFDRGADVSHFRYFVNADTRTALADWLVVDKPETISAFQALPDPQDFEADLAAALAASAQRDGSTDTRPIVVLLPGVMGSHLAAQDRGRVWFAPLAIANGGIADVAWEQPGVEADGLFAMFYGQVCRHLAAGHRIEPFPYDWRQPLDVLGDRFGTFLERLLAQSEATGQPVRLLAHSMGGLVVRACIHRRRAVMDRLMARDGARLVMLGTPNQGSHAMVENLIGKGDSVRSLVRLDLRHDMQDILDLMAGFRGPLQLLPHPNFKDQFQGQPEDGGGLHDYWSSSTWAGFKTQVRDLWFGDGRAAVPEQAVLDSARWLWTQDKDKPALPSEYAPKSVYVFGVARATPCGLRVEGQRLRMVATPHGDGTVTWASGRIGGFGASYYMPVEHGDLLATPAHFEAIGDLLNAGSTSRLSSSPPTSRAIEQPVPMIHDAGPPLVADADMVARAILGSSMRDRLSVRPQRRLNVTVKAMDLRFIHRPIMVGHYLQDPIAGAEALVDEALVDGQLRERHDLGLYAGARGTATVVLKANGGSAGARNPAGGMSSVSGAIVTGLGTYDAPLGQADLTDAVRVGVLRYLLHVVDVLGRKDFDAPLAVLLLGYNSTANLSVAASVEALVRGVVEANAGFAQTTGLKVQVATLDIVELYLDTAITAVYALRRLAPRLQEHAERRGIALTCAPELVHGEGYRQRLFDGGGARYWPRLLVTDADARDPLADGAERSAAAAVTPANAPILAAGQRPPYATRLRYLYVGQRARAESVVQQRQPGVVEQLVRQQIRIKTWMPEFGRMLFQLMVPHDFKGAARELDRVVLVVDATTANVPWEMMLGDEGGTSTDEALPLALRTAAVRQFVTPQYRRQVRQSLSRTALVVGNPKLDGFKDFYLAPDGKPLDKDLDLLEGAEREAHAVSTLLQQMDYDVETAIGEDATAVVVMSQLFKRSWRLLHVSAHGVFDARHVDGTRRSGVVLSGGLLITAAEIQSMEVVPELVFLNCCHLGRADMDRDGNKLAASLARELIDIGVRCIVVAGWAVTDDLAQMFGEVFYERLLRDRMSFGDAIHEARKAVWKERPQDITWGAFQAYGDPGWRADPQAERNLSRGEGDTYVSPDELLDDLARIRVNLHRRSSQQANGGREAVAEQVTRLLDKRTPAAWRQQPQVLAAVGQTWYEVGDFAQARKAFLDAIQKVDMVGQVPIRDIERLANTEARWGERKARDETQQSLGRKPPSENLIDTAIARLHELGNLVGTRDVSSIGDGVATPVTVSGSSPHSERSALLGSAYKRKASVQALRLLYGTRREGGMPAKELAEVKQGLDLSLRASVAAYRSAEGTPRQPGFQRYLALNRLALDALTDWASPAARTAALELARYCQDSHDDDTEPTAWDALMPAEGRLVEYLLDGSLALAGRDGDQALERIVVLYRDTLAAVGIKPRQLDSVTTQMELLSRFFDAFAVLRPDEREQHTRRADRLLALVNSIRPGAPARTDRPRFDDGSPVPARQAADPVAPSAKATKAAKPRKAPARSTRRKAP